MPRGIGHGTRRVALDAQDRDHRPPGMATAYDVSRAQALGTRATGLSQMRPEIHAAAATQEGRFIV